MWDTTYKERVVSTKGDKILKKINSQHPESRSNPDATKFRLFLLGKEDWDIEILEVNKIDYEIINRNLNLGKSVFISGTNQQNNPVPSVMSTDSSHFYRI